MGKLTDLVQVAHHLHSLDADTAAVFGVRNCIATLSGFHQTDIIVNNSFPLNKVVQSHINVIFRPQVACA